MKKFSLTIFLAAVSTTIILLPLWLLANQSSIVTNNKIISPLPDNFTDPLPVPTEEVKGVSDLNLIDEINSLINSTPGKFALSVKNLKTGTEIGINEQNQFPSASLYKLWIMAETFRQINQGKLTPDTVLSESISTLNRKFDIASESAEQTEGVITLSVSEALNKMIILSDNYSALLLSAKIRLSNVTKFLLSSGFTGSSLGEPPLTTASDTARFFEEIYLGRMVDQDYSEKMLEILKKQTINRKIPKYLPEGTIVAHKTGELGSVSHDCGIIYGLKTDILFCMLSDSDNVLAAEELIAKTAQKTFEYYEK